MKKLYSPLLLFFSVGVYTHQDPLYAPFLNNPMLLNPVYTGSNQHWQTTAGDRSQSLVFDSHPTTLNFSSHLSLDDNKVGAGLITLQDKIGEGQEYRGQRFLSYEISLSYSFPFLDFHDRSMFSNL